MRYVWLNILTGEFSNSWNEKEHELYGGRIDTANTEITLFI